jgi:hypothetical protein
MDNIATFRFLIVGVIQRAQLRPPYGRELGGASGVQSTLYVDMGGDSR